MPSVIKYTLLLAADLVIIGCLVHFTFCTLRGSTALEEFTARSQASSARFDKLKAYSYFVVVLLGFGLALCGALIFLFSWMPDRWVTLGKDLMWIPEGLLGTGVLFGTVALTQQLTKTHAKLLELHHSQLRLRKVNSFEQLIKRELAQIGRMLRRSKLEADALVGLGREIDEAEEGHKIYPQHVELCREMLDLFRIARGASQ